MARVTRSKIIALSEDLLLKQFADCNGEGSNKQKSPNDNSYATYGSMTYFKSGSTFEVNFHYS